MDVRAEFSRGCELFASGNFAEAEAAFRKCLDVCPGEADLFNALGSTLDARGKMEDAQQCLAEACRLRPGFAPFRFNFGNVLRRLKRRQEAEREYVEAIRLDPSLAVAFHGLGSLYREDDMLDSAEACLQQAVLLAPEFAPALHDLGQIRQLQGRDRDAEDLYRQAVAADAGYLPALNSLGMLLLRMNKAGEARSCFEAALATDPQYLQARCNLGVLATWAGDLDTAIRELKIVTAAAPEDGDAHFNLSLALLAAGRYDEGWQEHEWRFRKAKPVPKRHEHIPRWTGEPVAGLRILVHAEQGYGDSLQFIRYAATLAERGATVLVEGQDRNITPLLATAQGVTAAFARGGEVPPADLQVPMVSLPLHLGEQSWPPPAPPYLFAQPDKARYWKERLGSLPGLRVGLAWAGRPEHDNDANRSLPPEVILPLTIVEGVSLVSLQFGPGAVAQPALHDFAADIHDFSDSAALVSGLDLVITVDSAVAHLAGALGIRTWLLLPWNPDWRWMRDHRDSPWYPGMTIYRQSAPAGWPEVVAEVAADLAMEAGKRPETNEVCGTEGEDTAWATACRAVAAEPNNIATWRTLVNAAMASTSPGHCLLPEEAFLTALTPASNHLDELAATGLFFLRRDARFAQLFATDGPGAIDDLLKSGRLDILFSSGPLQKLCELAILCDPDGERLLTGIRRALLAGCGESALRSRINGTYLPFVCALATLCFNNEYIFLQTAEEDASLSQLRQWADNGQLDLRRDPGLMALLGTYHPLHDLKGSFSLTDGPAVPPGSPLERLLNVQVREPLEERRIATDIPRLTEIDDTVSQTVRKQYEENPYPRWVGIRLPAPRPLSDVLQAVSPGLALSSRLDKDKPSILVAGCGTGQHPIFTAARFAGSKVLAIDLSLASLAYAKRKAIELGAASITFMQADILALGSVPRQFDVIECGGVLHHMRDPVRGWQILLRLLKPGGIMGIGLYSRLARRWINQAKEMVAGKESLPTPDGIRKLRHELWPSLPSHLTNSRDFFTMSGCRDLLFHVQEHQFDLQQLASILQELKLEFLGFQLSAAIVDTFRSRFPEEGSLTDLPRWKEFEEENPDTFRNMYQFYVRKPEG